VRKRTLRVRANSIRLLTPGPHTLKIRVTGTANAYARAKYVTADRFDVYVTTPGSVAPGCASCH
jgi:hypothetical protein